MRKLQPAPRLHARQTRRFRDRVQATRPDGKRWFMALSASITADGGSDGTVTRAMFSLQKGAGGAFCPPAKRCDFLPLRLFGARKWLKELSPTDPWEWSLASAADTLNAVMDSSTFIMRFRRAEVLKKAPPCCASITQPGRAGFLSASWRWRDAIGPSMRLIHPGLGSRTRQHHARRFRTTQL